MNSVDSPPPKGQRRKCEKCGLTAPAPMIVAVPNPKDVTHGRCSNTEACDRRVRLITKHMPPNKP